MPQEISPPHGGGAATAFLTHSITTTSIPPPVPLAPTLLSFRPTCVAPANPTVCPSSHVKKACAGGHNVRCCNIPVCVPQQRMHEAVAYNTFVALSDTWRRHPNPSAGLLHHAVEVVTVHAVEGQGASHMARRWRWQPQSEEDVAWSEEGRDWRRRGWRKGRSREAAPAGGVLSRRALLGKEEENDRQRGVVGVRVKPYHRRATAGGARPKVGQEEWHV